MIPDFFPPEVWPDAPTGINQGKPGFSQRTLTLSVLIAPLGDSLYDSIENTIAVAANRYNGDHFDYDGDLDRYEETKNDWDRVKQTMYDANQTQYTTCLQHLNQEHSEGQAEHDYLYSAYQHGQLAKNELALGAAATGQQQMMHYQLATGHANSMTQCCQMAEAKHTTFRSADAATWVDLDQYG